MGKNYPKLIRSFDNAELHSLVVENIKNSGSTRKASI